MGSLRLEHITKRYGDRTVVDDVSLSVEPGRVRALVGENGAGKSTLIRIASGLVRPDRGHVLADDRSLPPGDPRRASEVGIGIVHQHFMLVDTLTVAENVVLGAEPRRGPLGWFLDRDAARARVRSLADTYGLEVDADARIEALTVGERQRVELLKVLHRGARWVLLDEPTAVLSPREIDALLEMIRGLVRGGAGVLFVSHKLDEVLAVADEITVLRRGRDSLSRPRAGVTREEIARAIVGGDVPTVTRPDAGAGNSESRAGASTETPTSGIALDGVRATGVGPVTLAVRRGEILGIAGVEGNGQRALAEAIAGLRPILDGELRLGSRTCTALDVAARRSIGLGFVPEDREGSGLVGELSVFENVRLGDPRVASRANGLLRATARDDVRRWIERFDVRPPDLDAPVRALSGGNAQKVLLVRELSRSLVALVIAQPTRGVDIGAAAEIHSQLLAARGAGVAIVLITSDLDELRLLSDRVVVMRRGVFVGEMPVADASDEKLGALMVGDAKGAAA